MSWECAKSPASLRNLESVVQWVLLPHSVVQVSPKICLNPWRQEGDPPHSSSAQDANRAGSISGDIMTIPSIWNGQRIDYFPANQLVQLSRTLKWTGTLFSHRWQIAHTYYSTQHPLLNMSHLSPASSRTPEPFVVTQSDCVHPQWTQSAGLLTLPAAQCTCQNVQFHQGERRPTAPVKGYQVLLQAVKLWSPPCSPA